MKIYKQIRNKEYCMTDTINPYAILLFGGFMWSALLVVGYKLSLSMNKKNEKICVAIWEIIKYLTGALAGFFFGLAGGFK